MNVQMTRRATMLVMSVGDGGRGQSTVGKGALTRIEDHVYICVPARKSACIRACVSVCASIGALV